MGVVRFLRAHLDSVVAVLLTIAYLAEVGIADTAVVGESYMRGLELEESLAIAVGAVFLLSLATRSTVPLLPLGLAFAALIVLGRGSLDDLATIAIGLVLASYSVGAWADGRIGQIGALGVGALAGLAVIRASGDAAEPRDLAIPVFLLIGAWLLGLGVRGWRADRGDLRVAGVPDWEQETATPDSAGRDDVVRELRDVIERAMSAVVLAARDARRALDDDPDAAARALGVIEAAGTEALDETQRLTGQLLSPDGAPLPEPRPGLDDLDYLAEQVSAAGLPVDMRVEGRPLPLTPDLDATAYRVVHEALMTTLEHATSAHSSVVVRYEPDELQIEVTDDGAGIEGDDTDEETAGLIAVRRDVAALGGSLDAGPGEERGYWVLARLPYEPDRG